ncbi:unnamed protein product [Urochloa humidicola]
MASSRRCIGIRSYSLRSRHRGAVASHPAAATSGSKSRFRILRQIDEGGSLERGTAESSDLKKGAVNAIQDLYEVVHHEVFSIDMSAYLDEWTQINRARAEGRLFNNLKWPNDPGL